MRFTSLLKPEVLQHVLRAVKHRLTPPPLIGTARAATVTTRVVSVELLGISTTSPGLDALYADKTMSSEERAMVRISDETTLVITLDWDDFSVCFQGRLIEGHDGRRQLWIRYVIDPKYRDVAFKLFLQHYPLVETEHGVWVCTEKTQFYKGTRVSTLSGEENLWTYWFLYQPVDITNL